jgi:hypothetical protein
LWTFAASAINHSVTRPLQPIDEFVSPMLGLPAWNVGRGHGSFLTFEFGEPRLDQPGGRNAAGQWHLWIYCCHWRAFQGASVLAWSEDGHELIDRAASRLNGQKLVAVMVDPSQGRSTFTFDLGGLLETWPYGDDPTEEQWMILTSSEAFAYRADGRYHRDPSDTPPDQERWLAFD